jgi:hypothetical protein
MGHCESRIKRDKETTYILLLLIRLLRSPKLLETRGSVGSLFIQNTKIVRWFSRTGADLRTQISILYLVTRSGSNCGNNGREGVIMEFRRPRIGQLPHCNLYFVSCNTSLYFHLFQKPRNVENYGLYILCIIFFFFLWIFIIDTLQK